MTQTPSPVRDELDAILTSVEAMDLTPYALDLEAKGYTVLPPSMGLSAAETALLLEAVLDVAERRNGVRPDLATGATHSEMRSPFGEHMRLLLGEGEIFERLLLHPVASTFMRWLLGENCVLSSFSSMMKGPGRKALDLHTDSQFVPAPLPPYAQVANCTFALTDYSRESGSLCFVPGSHRWGRHPEPYEAALDESIMPIDSIEAPAGSLVIWHGNTWHGAYPRATTGLRVNVVMLFSRLYMQTREDYRGQLPPEVLARNPEEFSRLVGERNPLGWRSPDEYDALAPRFKATMDVGRTALS